MRTHLRVCLLSCVLATSAHASPITQLQSEVTYEVRADATYTVEQRVRMRVDDAGGVRGMGQMPLSYSESLQTLEVLEAYTTTRDGTRIDVAPDKIVDQQAPQSRGAAMFSDRRLKVVIFPQVEVGSTITARWRRTQLKPEIPGLFSLWETAADSIDREPETISLRAPASLSLHIDTRDADGGELASPAPGMREWRWNFKAVKGLPPEPRQPHPRDNAAFVMVSTFESYEQLARAYSSRAAPMSKPSPDIVKMAKEITAGIHDKRAQAKALYEWVSANIRYVSIVLDTGGYVPHEAGAILAARYGDCKDHVALLEALLSAMKIRSSPSLIQASDSFVIPGIVAAGAFNHVITYLPDFDLFVDSTPGELPFGELSVHEHGKQTLVVDTGKGEPELRRLPMPSPSRDWAVSRVDFSVAEDGSMTGTVTGESAGLYEVQDRNALRTLPKEQLPNVLNGTMGGNGTGTLEMGDPRDLGKPFAYSARVEMPKHIKLPGPGAFELPTGVARFNGTLLQFTRYLASPKRTRPMECPAAGKRTEISRLRLPASLDVTRIPEGVVREMKYGRYESKYEREGDVIVTTRTLTIEYPTAVCMPADYTELRDLATAIRDDMRAQVVYD